MMPRTYTRTPAIARVSRLVDLDGPHDECWIWPSRLSQAGYGSVFGYKSDGTRTTLGVHRVVYQHLVGSVPAGLVLDHLCRNRACCNPAHLEPVTQRENVRRGDRAFGIHSAQTHCLRGHEFTPENTLQSRAPYGVKRQCRACARIREQKARAKRRQS